MARLHEWELDVDEATVARLIAEQFPHWAGLSVRRLHTTGTVNHVFRLGDDLAVRVPRAEAWAAGLEHELRWLPLLAPRVPLAVPQPVARGAPVAGPGAGVPFTWAVYRWLAGEPLGEDPVEDERSLAADLAGFVTALRRIDTSGAPAAGRRPLRELDRETREALSAADGIDGTSALAAWELALESPPWDGRGVWIHADLLRPNLLIVDRKLSAVLDFGMSGVGDPAADLIAAWTVFGVDGRRAYLQALEADEGAIDRARGYALHQAALIIPYYTRTNPGLAAHARRTVREVLADVDPALD